MFAQHRFITKVWSTKQRQAKGQLGPETCTANVDMPEKRSKNGVLGTLRRPRAVQHDPLWFDTAVHAQLPNNYPALDPILHVFLAGHLRGQLLGIKS